MSGSQGGWTRSVCIKQTWSERHLEYRVSIWTSMEGLCVAYRDACGLLVSLAGTVLVESNLGGVMKLEIGYAQSWEWSREH